MSKETNVPSLYEQLKNYRGSINEVAKEAECSRDWVLKVLGLRKWRDDELEIVAARVLIRRKKEQREVNERKSIIKEALTMEV